MRMKKKLSKGVREPKKRTKTKLWYTRFIIARARDEEEETAWEQGRTTKQREIQKEEKSPYMCAHCIINQLNRWEVDRNRKAEKEVVVPRVKKKRAKKREIRKSRRKLEDRRTNRKCPKKAKWHKVNGKWKKLKKWDKRWGCHIYG